METQRNETAHVAKRAWGRRLLIAAAALLLVAALVWLSAGRVITSMVERDLRSAGFVEPEVVGASLVAGGIAVRRVRLAGEDLELEGVRAEIGTAGIEKLSVDTLRLRAAVDENGRITLPPGVEIDGGDAGAESGGAALDLVPPGGIEVGSGEIVVETPAGPAALRLTDLHVERGNDDGRMEARYALEHSSGRLQGAATAELKRDGALHARVGIDDGRLETHGVRVAQLTGEVTATVPAQGSPTIEASLAAAETTVRDHDVGAVALTTALNDGNASFTLESHGPLVTEAAIDGRAVFGSELRSLEAAGRARLASDEAQGELELALHLTNDASSGRELSGRVQIDGRGLTLPALVGDASFDLAAELAASTERVSLTSTTPWTAELTPAPALLPETLRALTGERVTLELTPRNGRPVELLATFTDSRARLDAALTARATAAQIRAAGIFDGRWAEPVEASAEELRFDAEALPWGELSLGVDDFAGEAAYAQTEWRLRGAGTLLGSGTAGGATVDGLSARWSGSIVRAEDSVTLTADDCVEWRVAALAWGDVRIANAALPCIDARGDSPLAVYRAATGGVQFELEAAEAPLDGELSRSGEAIEVKGSWPALTLAGDIGGDGLTSLDASFRGGQLALPSERIAVSGLQGTLQIAKSELRTATLAAAGVTSEAEPPLWAPLELEASARKDDTALEIEALLSDALGIVVIELAGRADDGAGTADVTLHPLQFVSGATQVGDLSPALAEKVTDASGTVGFNGAIAWDESGMRSSGELRMDGIGATVSGVRVTGVDGRAALSSLVPPATLPGQTLRIATLDLGVPLTDGAAVYALEANGRVAVQELTFDLAGGRLSTEPFTIDSAAFSDIRFVLEADDVDLSQLLALSQIQGLDGTGALSGRVPVRVSARGIELDDGVLAAETTGTLRYTPDNLPEFLRGDDVRSRMLREALTNFQYDELAITITGDSEESAEQLVRLSAKGANPDFLEGHPIELNFNFRGPLLGAVRSAVDLTSAEAVQQLFEQQNERDLESAP